MIYILAIWHLTIFRGRLQHGVEDLIVIVIGQGGHGAVALDSISCRVNLWIEILVALGEGEDSAAVSDGLKSN